MPREYLTLNKVTAYKKVLALSNKVWDAVVQWDYFTKDTVGKQKVRSVDSISANIAEGFGRFNKKDKIHFYRIARASVYESLDWAEKTKKRGLLTEKEYKDIHETLKSLPKEINALIKYTNNNLTI